MVVFVITSQFLKNTGKTIAAVVLTALFGFAMFSVGQNSIANKSCVHMGFTSGRAMSNGIACTKAERINLIYQTQPQTLPTE